MGRGQQDFAGMMRRGRQHRRCCFIQYVSLANYFVFFLHAQTHCKVGGREREGGRGRREGQKDFAEMMRREDTTDDAVSYSMCYIRKLSER